MPLSPESSLHCQVTQTLIVAYKEDTQLLEAALEREALKGEVIRQVHQPTYENYARNALAMLNHCEAWKRASQVKGLTLVVEADFVPVRGMGMLPLPMGPDNPNIGIAWLYTCAPQLYSVSEEGYAQGFSSAMVAYLITPAGAIALLDMANDIRRSPGLDTYYSWDSKICDFLRERGFETFIPLRNYGEHGGYPNPEHRKYGLSVTHRADVLYGPLAFMPLYAQATPETAAALNPWLAHISYRVRFWGTRLYARIKGLGRLLMGKFVRGKVVRESSVPTWLLWFSIRRQLSWHL
ncbi:MAG: LPS biosynthesis glycosyltransferase [Leptolyngbyaceae bacterium]|nr:LPS biosynthesis glycosyltransferase [Leptolyngbyaceae bacterium]